MDGLPGMQRGLDTAISENVAPITKMVGPRAPLHPWGPRSGTLNAKISYYMFRLQNIQLNLLTAALAILLAFLIGLTVAKYLPELQQQSYRVQSKIL